MHGQAHTPVFHYVCDAIESSVIPTLLYTYAPASDSESRVMQQSGNEQFEAKQIGTTGELSCIDEKQNSVDTGATHATECQRSTASEGACGLGLRSRNSGQPITNAHMPCK